MKNELTGLRGSLGGLPNGPKGREPKGWDHVAHIIDGYPLIFIDGYPSMNIIDGSMIFINEYQWISSSLKFSSLKLSSLKKHAAQ